LIPASGYYEWPVIDGKKRPHWIHLADAPVMMFGGVWETRSDGAGGALLTYSIVTRAADPVIRPVHDRMPLILPPEVLHDWLHGDADEAMAHRACRARAGAGWFHESTRRRGNVRQPGRAPVAPMPCAADGLFP
jgi:putative SOS response-associated peptidase YedK